jgi:hypothetical protein
MILALLIRLVLASSAQAASLKNVLVVRGAAFDKTPLNGARGGANINRLRGFGSDIYYDRFANVFFGLTDRGPGGGTIGYGTRVHKFTLDIHPVTGTAGNFKLLATIPFTIPGGKTINGIAGPAAGATNESRMSPAGTNSLPAGVVPVSKKLFIDLLAELKAAGSIVPEKIEGLTIGPRLTDGTYELLVVTDNETLLHRRRLEQDLRG